MIIEHDFGFAVSPIKSTQLELCDTLLCLDIPYTKEYGLTKTGVKTRVIKTESDTIECYFMDKVKLNGKVMSAYEVKIQLIRKYIK